MWSGTTTPHGSWIRSGKKQTRLERPARAFSLHSTVPWSPQLVLLRQIVRAVLPIEGHAQVNVDVAVVLLVAAHGDLALEALARVDDEHLVEVEHRLVPVGVRGARRRAERHRLVAAAERAVEVRHERVHVVVARRREAELRAEVEV